MLLYKAFRFFAVASAATFTLAILGSFRLLIPDAVVAVMAFVTLLLTIAVLIVGIALELAITEFALTLGWMAVTIWKLAG